MSQIYKDSAADLSGVLTLTGDSGGAVPPAAGNINILGGVGVTVTGNPGTNTLTIDIGGGGADWSVIGAGQTMIIDHGYVCTTGGTLSLLLPATSPIGSIIEVTLDGSTGFTITEAAGQQIRMGNLSTTLGATGTLGSNAQGDSLRMVCSVANTKWNVLSSMGSLTVA